MAGIDEEYYQQMIQADTHDEHWTQFELDLILSIRDDYPIIYTKMGEMNRHQRAAKIRSAWKVIGSKFPEIPMTYIKARWRSILDNYLKVKLYAGSTTGFNAELVKNKFMDGTLSFLEGEVDLFFDHHKASKNHNYPASGKELSEEENKPIVMDIKKSLHEEVDLGDDSEIVVKKEDNDTDSEDDFDTVREPVFLGLPRQTLLDGVEEPKKKIWSEEELMNATRLTKEMIDQLILIKTRHYYMAPAVSK